VNREKLIRMQALLHECPEVFAVYVRVDGEENIDAIWQTRAAADLHAGHQNRMPAYFGRARVVPMRIRTEALANLWFEGK
jgi:hypothetical protein